MTRPIRFGVLGAAKFAREFMAPAIHEASGAVFAALATSSAEKAAPFQAFQPDLKVFDDYDALLKSDDIDAVYVPLPNSLHVEWCLKAMDAGKHVLCEKPIAMKAEEIDQLIAKRDETGLMCVEAYMIAHHPQWHRVRELIATGEIGELKRVETAFSFNLSDAENIRLRPETGGGALGDIGVYALGCARLVTGEEPEKITYAKIEYENGVDVTAEVSARFPSFDFHGYVSMQLARCQTVRFHGREGVITLRTPFNASTPAGAPEIEISDGSGSYRVETFHPARQYKLQVENFVRTLTEGAEYPWTLENARGTQAMIDAVFDADQGWK
ncbi:Gfo/Idh/MocA family protein [Celeribacter litoreus]|uniref:Gfo/Idh/MocA family protein n=1 Tax=Celeribacter litoreus TaxID=2876714 RepID=UPI001CCB39D5|nr:Gfo/Idh/MocA family oxidoreductase [Celeribacter litoreus]MCA0043036.1 Gfo/Idh/MocA family oxidoreductase [Celeribacter litoreus]